MSESCFVRKLRAGLRSFCLFLSWFLIQVKGVVWEKEDGKEKVLLSLTKGSRFETGTCPQGNGGQCEGTWKKLWIWFQETGLQASSIFKMWVCVSCSVVSDSLQPRWTVAHQAPLSMRILQARILTWVAYPFSRVSSQPRDRTQVSHAAGRFFTIWTTRQAPSFNYWPIYWGRSFVLWT